jgi:hypothetical protein
MTGAKGCNHMLRPKTGIFEWPNIEGVRAMKHEGNNPGCVCVFNHTDSIIGYTLLWIKHSFRSVTHVKGHCNGNIGPINNFTRQKIASR